MTRETKGRKKRGAKDDGNTPKKSHKRSSAESDDNEDKAEGGANGASGDGERSTAYNGREASGTQGARNQKTTSTAQRLHLMAMQRQMKTMLPKRQKAERSAAPTTTKHQAHNKALDQKTTSTEVSI